MLILIRHAPTAWNISKRIDDEILRGHFDLPLTDAGRNEARRNAYKLVRFQVSEVRSSQFKRDHETGAIVAQICNCRHVVNEQMAPFNIGTLAGNTIGKVWPYLQRMFRDYTLRPPNGESYGDFLARWGPILRDSLAESRQRTIVVIVQGTVIRSLKTIFKGIPPDTNKWDFVKPAEMLFLEWDDVY